jgi:hypothetical protein
MPCTPATRLRCSRAARGNSGGKPPIEIRLSKKLRRSRIRRGWRTFRGGVVDTGAPVSVIGLKEARLYFQLLGIPFDRGKASTRSFKFGSNACKVKES